METPNEFKNTESQNSQKTLQKQKTQKKKKAPNLTKKDMLFLELNEIITVSSSMLEKIIISLTILKIYKTPNFEISYLFLTLTFCQFLKITYITYILKKKKKLIDTENMSLENLENISFLILYTTIYFFLTKSLEKSYLPYFAILHIGFIMYISFKKCCDPDLSFSFYTFFESFQIFYVFLKISNPFYFSDWTWVLLFSYLVGIVYLIFAVFLFFFLIFTFYVYFFVKEKEKNNENNFEDFKSFFLNVCLMFYNIFNNSTYYFVLSGFHYLLDEDFITPGGRIGLKNNRLYNISLAVFIFSGIYLGVLIFIYFKYRSEFLDSIKKFGKKSFSDDFFKKNE